MAVLGGGKVQRRGGGRGRWRTRGTALCIREWARLLHLAVSNARRDGNVLPEYSRKLEFMVERDRDTHTMCFHSLIMNNCDVQRASLDSLGYESDDASVDVYPRRTRVLSLRGIALERIFHATDFSRIFISHCVPGRLSMVWGQDFARWVVCTQFYPVIGSMNNDPGF